MTLFAFALLLGVAFGYLLRGRLSNLGLARIRWWGFIVAGLLLQFVPLPGGDGGTDLLIRTVVLSLSFIMLVSFALINVRVPGMVLIMVGVLANFAVIAANGGMPVSADALRDSGQHAELAQMRQSDADKHHLVTDSDSSTFLDDIIHAASWHGDGTGDRDFARPSAEDTDALVGLRPLHAQQAEPDDLGRRRARRHRDEQARPVQLAIGDARHALRSLPGVWLRVEA